MKGIRFFFTSSRELLIKHTIPGDQQRGRTDKEENDAQLFATAAANIHFQTGFLAV
jgi:hypothetical protein